MSILKTLKDSYSLISRLIKIKNLNSLRVYLYLIKGIFNK